MKTRLERGKIMKKKKGFTLIELLAVIVILAIIALIAVPVVMNIIDKANKSAFKDSAYGILKAGELFYTNKLLETTGMIEDKVFDFSNDTSDLEINGSKPTGGTMIVRKDGKISMAIHNGKHCVTKGFEDDDVTITDDVENCNLSDGGNSNNKTLSDLVVDYDFNGDGTKEVTKNDCMNNKTEGACAPGTAFAIPVNATQTYKFYVVEDKGTEVTLIMDRNLGVRVAWVSKLDYNDNSNYGSYGNNNKGPITVLNYLNTQTENWDNIPAIKKYEYDGNAGSYGYQKLLIESGIGKLTSKDGAMITEITGVSRARLLTYEEATSTAIGCTTSSGSCPKWIYGNTSSSNTTESPYGYWLLSADQSFSSYGRTVYYNGYVLTTGSVYSATNYGARPVITLSK